MSPLHLIWIIPLLVMSGVFLVALLMANKDKERE